MKKFLLKLILFLSPFLILVLFIAMVDPYDFINISQIIDSDVKYKVMKRSDEVSPRGSVLWNVVHFKRNPVDNILIGDSQGANIRVELVEKLTSEKYFNFSVPGASYESMFDMFWEATRHHKLEKVYFQVAFMNFNLQRSYNIFHFASDYCDNPYKYFFCRNILRDAFVNVLYSMTKDPKLVTNPFEYASLEYLDEKSHLTLDGFFRNYAYPAVYIEEIGKIVEYCREKDIELIFVILPTYSGVFEYLEQHDLMDSFNAFKADILALGPTIDFHTINESTNNRNNFTDYFHPKPYFIDEITWKIWGEGDYQTLAN